MKKILLLVMVCCVAMGAQAQRLYFFYLQSQSQSPFYLKTGDKVYSSSAQGYLIVPRLVDSTYNVVIGKPGIPEVRFTIGVNGKDHGFLLRDNGPQLSLFHLQNMTLIEAAPAAEGSVSYVQKTDRFTALLSQAANDTTLLQMAVFAKKEPKPAPPKAAPAATDAVENTTTATIAATETKDTQTIAAVKPKPETVDTVVVAVQEKETTAQTAATNQQEEQTAKKEEARTEEVKTAAAATDTAVAQPVAEAPATTTGESEFKRSVVVRRAESSTSEGFGLLFTDSADGVVDTIRLVIPNQRVAFATAEPETEKEDSTPLQLQKATPATETTKKEKKSERKAAPEKVAVAKEAGCKGNASNSDLARLRRNMVNRNSEDDMIAEGAKAFASKCYSTDQLKTLSSLLLTSNGRYRFFEAAYPHVSDKANFRSLQNELWDRADIERFKALLSQ